MRGVRAAPATARAAINGRAIVRSSSPGVSKQKQHAEARVADVPLSRTGERGPHTAWRRTLGHGHGTARYATLASAPHRNTPRGHQPAMRRWRPGLPCPTLPVAVWGNDRSQLGPEARRGGACVAWARFAGERYEEQLNARKEHIVRALRR